MRKICFVTGTRADYGIMSGLMKHLQADKDVQLQVIATNMHLSRAHGMTVSEIEADGIRVDERVPMPEADGDPANTVNAMGIELQGLAKAFSRLKPDMAVILGDRYEMLAAASAALIFGIPVAHLYGGEITEGAYDDSIRHAITKLSRLHFTSTEEYRSRVIAMGEHPDTVIHAGALGADNISKFTPMSLAQLEESLGAELDPDFLLTTFHPVTNEPGQEEAQTEALLQALEPYLEHHRILFTMPNADTGGARVAALIRRWAAQHPQRVVTAVSLGRVRYYSALAHCAAVVGNSSSALTEAPSFGIPSVDIGNRQKGRAAGSTVIHCNAERQDIAQALEKALSADFRNQCRQNPDNPYFRKGSLQRIASVLTTVELPMPPFKEFYEGNLH